MRDKYRNAPTRLMLAEVSKNPASRISTAAAALILAFSTAAIGYAFSIVSENRRSKIERIDKQIREFYGPIYILTQSNDVVWTKFVERFWAVNLKNRSDYFDDASPPDTAQVEVWRRWMKSVFQPMNEKVVAITIEHGDQVGSQELPVALKILVAHTEAYRAVIDGWESTTVVSNLPTDSAANTALIPYPYPQLSICIRNRYLALKNERRRLESSVLAIGDFHFEADANCDRIN